MKRQIVHLRREVALALDPGLRETAGLSLANRWIIGLVLASAAVAILGTEDALTAGLEGWFHAAEVLFLAVFGLEYFLRVWSSIENPAFESRVRYAMRWPALLDLATLVAVTLSLAGGSGFLLRLMRVVRLLRFAHLGQYSNAISLVAEAVAARRFELVVSGAVAALLLLFSSALLYVAEGGEQPEAFGSIPRAMWWSIATLTTVGYGDATPITALGKLFAGMTALAGIGLIAMPTGILAAAFSQAVQKAGSRTGGEGG